MLHLCGMKKPAVNEASLKQGMAPLCCTNCPSFSTSPLSSALLFSPFFVLFSFALQAPCLLLQYYRTGKNPKNKQTKNNRLTTHVTAPISGGRYVRAAMCSHYPVTVLCWGYSNWDMFSSCKMKTPRLLLVTTTSVLLFGTFILPGVS